jgi:hypothetical protein
MYIVFFKDSEMSIRQALEGSGIEFLIRAPRPGIISAAGSIIELAQAAVTSGAIAGVLVAWVKARASREIQVTLEDRRVLSLKGYSSEQVKELLPLINKAVAIDTKPAD